MIWSIVGSFLHFLAAFGVCAMVLYELVFLSQTPSLTTAKNIQRADMIYGLSALLVVLMGFIRVYYFEKGPDYYFNNPFFWIKLNAFAGVGLLSIYPSIKFFQWKPLLKSKTAPLLTTQTYHILRTLLILEVIGLLVMMISASLMAKGVAF
jgi:putative membrane protein